MAVQAEVVSAEALPHENAQHTASLAANNLTGVDAFRRPVFNPRDQFDRYMADVKRTELMSPSTLIMVARQSYQARYEIYKTLSQFPPCADAVVEQFECYEREGFQLSGFIDSYGDQSVEAKDALAMLNERLGQGKVENSLEEEESRRRGLEMLRAHWQLYKDADPAMRANRNSMVRKRLSHTFLYFGFRYAEFERLCRIFEDVTFEVQRFADLFVALVPDTAFLHILDRFTDDDVQAIMHKINGPDQQRFYRDASRLRQRLQDIGLSIRECIELRSDYEYHKKEIDRLNNSIVEANLLLSASRAIRQRPHDDRLFDTCQEANEGLITAVNRFSYWKGYKFATYACRWIDQRLQRNRQHTVNSDFPVPISIVNRGFKINQVREKHGESAGARPLTAAQVAKRVGCSREQVDEVTVAFNALSHSEELAMAIPCEQTSASSLAELSEVQTIVRKALELLPDKKKREVCRLRWGIGDFEPLSLSEVGKVMGLSTERVRNIESECMKALSRCTLSGQMRELIADN